MILKNLLTLRRLDRVVENIYENIISEKEGSDSLVVRVDLLEKKFKVLQCNHEYTKWERHEVSQWGPLTAIYAIGTCRHCGHTVEKYPATMKPAEKKRFIDMGILCVEDFPKKAKK